MSMHGPWTAMRSLTRDGEVTKRKLAPGTIPRIVGFARPYKREIGFFLVLVVLDAVLGGGPPAALQGDHRRRRAGQNARARWSRRVVIGRRAGDRRAGAGRRAASPSSQRLLLRPRR